jgi:alanine-synthesizing transaminase
MTPLHKNLRIDDLPPYVLGEVAHAVSEKRSSGYDVIDLSQLNPNLGPEPHAIDKLVQAVLQPHNHRYSSSQGISKLRKVVADRYEQAFRVSLDPESEVVVTLGTKEGLAHLLLAIGNAGDTVLIPTPTYPIHTASVFVAGAHSLGIPLYRESDAGEGADGMLTAKSEGFFRRLEQRVESTWPKPKVLLLNFPHNPTTTVVSSCFYERIVDFAIRHSLFVVNDFAYADICFDGYKAPSILEVPRAKEVAVEFYSLSKGLSVPGWRMAFCVGNPRLVAALKKIKSYMDSGAFQPLQIAATSLLVQAEKVTKETQSTYQARRDVLYHGLRELGFCVRYPKSTMFLWADVPKEYAGLGSVGFSKYLLEKCSVAVCPGLGFGSDGEGALRFALVEPEHRLRQGLANMSELFKVKEQVHAR